MTRKTKQSTKLQSSDWRLVFNPFVGRATFLSFYVLAQSKLFSYKLLVDQFKVNVEKHR